MHIKYLLHISIGPVQSFIEQARKTQDLFAGSALITLLRIEAMKAIALYLKEKSELDKLEFITPFVANNNELVTDDTLGIDFFDKAKKPAQHLNKLECLISLQDIDVDELRTKTTGAILIFWNTHVDKVCEKWGIDKSTIQDQIATFPTITFLCNRYEDNEVSYAQAFAQQQTVLAGIKRTNSFTQIADGSESGKKCHVDNTFDIRIYRPRRVEYVSVSKGSLDLSDSEKDAIRRKLFAGESLNIITNEERVKIWHLAIGEGLSGISAMKRMVLNEPHSYQSTARIALWRTLKKMQDLRLSEYDAYEELLEKLPHSNDELYFKENLTVQYFNKYEILGKEVVERDVEPFVSAHDALLTKARSIGLSFTKYYAVFKFDGDNSNKWLSGYWLNKPEFTLQEFHTAYSKAQYDFVRELTEKFKSMCASVVYAGEDFLVFFNIEHFAKVLETIYTAYQTQIVLQLYKFKNPLFTEAQFSFSGGITVAHYKEPLQFVLDKTRAMEKLAKQNGRNMISVAALNASGGENNITIPWITRTNKSLYELIEFVLFHLENKTVSSAFLRELARQDRIYRGAMPMNLYSFFYERTVKRAFNEKNSSGVVLTEPERSKLWDHFREIADYLNWCQQSILRFFYLLDFIDRKTHEQ
ncbi:MAG TPA: type III-B CRISPR-associated protein Cas10/Cmr2 [Chitinophagales bacterium]|nr:type III-B CRISPR-associated protein Cas10/Cmr2 [Chitinophagales bacterium]HNO29225.1 type III-B CRISPR-associated protein Cas10/Cmr2 [Chitinophagales bacterium]